MCSGSTRSCVTPSEAGFPLLSGSFLVIHDCVVVAVQTDGWLSKFLKIM